VFPSSYRGVPQQIDQLIIIDRIVDLISPLATQLTYEGLLDEVYPIRNGELLIFHFFISVTFTQTNSF